MSEITTDYLEALKKLSNSKGLNPHKETFGLNEIQWSLLKVPADSDKLTPKLAILRRTTIQRVAKQFGHRSDDLEGEMISAAKNIVIRPKVVAEKPKLNGSCPAPNFMSSF